MISQSDIDQLLSKVQSAPKEELISRSICFEGLTSGDDVKPIWVDLEEGDHPSLRAAIRMGLLSESYEQWSLDGEFSPDGGDYVVRLTGVGTERLIELNEPCLTRMRKHTLAVFPTVLISIATAVLTSWAVHQFGAPK